MTAISGTTLRLRVLGAPSLTDDAGGTPPGLGWGKPLALLCYLAVRGEARRDELVDLLWRDVNEDKARNAFRQALHRLRSAFGDQTIPHDRDRLRIATSAQLTVDLTEFEQHARAARFDRAVATYAGDFLEGTELGEPAFDHWAEQERSKVRAQVRQLLQDATHDATAAGRWAEAIAYAKRLHTVAPFDADAAQLAATTLLSAGRRIEALEMLRHFADRTSRELGIETHPDVASLIARLELESPVERASRKRATRVERAALPFVGREAELSQLVAVWRTVGEERGATILLEGEAGIGKSRLTQELIANARSLGPVLALNGRERGSGAQLPYGIVAEALRPLTRAPGVAGASAHLLAEATRLLPELRDNLNLPAVNSVEDDAGRLRFFEGVAALVDAAAYEQRLLIVLEDLHHSPPSTIDLLSYLVARLAGAAVMFVLTIRPEEGPVIVRLRAITADAAPQGSDLRHVTLAPIGASDLHVALREMSETGSIPTASIDRIVGHAGGNPLRVMHAVNTVLAGYEVLSSPVPLRDVLFERLQRLTTTQRRIVLVLALLGRPAPLALVSAAAHVSDAAADEAVRALQTQDFVREREKGFDLANTIASDVALDVAGPAGRGFLAGWIADALARDASSGPAELARLWAMAGNASDAFINARRAAFDFLASGAAAEATQMLVLARTFAHSASEHADVEAALDALGAGRRRIVFGAKPAAVGGTRAREVRENELPAQDPPISARSPAHAGTDVDASLWRRLFPHWRILFGAALATLFISAVVLGMRSVDVAALGARGIDTLIVSEDVANSAGVHRLAVGNVAFGFVLSSRIDRTPSDPPWADSLPRDWTALPSPRGLRVAMSHNTVRGIDLFILGRDRRDSIPLLLHERSAAPLGWSPDGRWLLATRGRQTAGGFDVSLFAFRGTTGAAAIAIDTMAHHVVTEAAWSPDGTHIAWAARVGGDRQLEVFVSLADGSGVANVSENAADDYHIAWSPDGDLLAFTSLRDGNAELYAADIPGRRLWRLTQHPAQDDHATFSVDGRSIAFESSRGGSMGVFVMPTLGGEAKQIAAGNRIEIVDWRGPRAQFLDRVRVDVGAVAVGESRALELRAFDDVGDSVSVSHVDWAVLDTTVLRMIDSGDSSPGARVLGVKPGLARVVASVGRWRNDTAYVRVGDDSIALMADSLHELTRWFVLGRSAAQVRGDARGLALRAHDQWETGVLSRRVLPLLPGLEVRATMEAPWDSSPDIATEASISLVVPEDDANVDHIAPQFLKLASVSWKAEVGRVVYSVGKEVHSEAIGVTATRSREIRMLVEDDSTVAFSLDGLPRWHSTLRVATSVTGARAQLWLAGRALVDRVRITSLTARLIPNAGSKHN